MRDIDAGTIAAIGDDKVRIAILAQLDFQSGKEYLWAGPEGKSLEWDGDVYTSLADLGEIDKISEADGLGDSRTTVSLRLNSSQVDVPIGSDDSRGRDAIIIILLMDDNGDALGEIKFRKTMGQLSVAAEERREDGSRIVDERLSLELLDASEILRRSHVVRMTYEAGLRIDSDDHGLEFVSNPDAINIGALTNGRTFTITLPDGTTFDFDPRTIRPFGI